jgi:PAS domain S-box-containing protein
VLSLDGLTRRRLLLAYGLAVVTTMATLLTITAGFGIGPDTPVIVFVIPVMLTAYVGGLIPGLFSTALSALSAIYFVSPPVHSWHIANPVDNKRWITLLLTGVLISLLSEAQHRSRLRTRKNETRLAAIIGSTMEAIITVDERLQITLFNPAAEKMFACHAAEVLGRRVEQFIPNLFDSAEHLRVSGQPNAALQSIGGGTEIFARRANGALFPIEASIAQMEVAQDRQFTVVVREISEKKEAEAVRARLAAIVESSDDAIIGRSLDGVITAWNRGAEKLYGYTAEEALGKPISLIVPTERQHELEKMLLTIRRGGSVDNLETVRLRKDGTLVSVSLITSPVRNSQGRVVEASTIARDITERKRAEAENARLTTAIDQAAEAVVITDTDGRIQYVNPAFTSVTGYSRAEAQGQNPRLLQSGRHDSKFYHGMWRTILNGMVWRGEIINRRKDGSFLDEEMTIAPVRDSAGKITNFIAIKQDITDRKRAEEALVRSQRILAQAEQLAQVGAWETGIANGELVGNSTLNWSDETYRIFGYAPGAVAASHPLFLEHVHPEDRMRVRDALSRAIADRTPYSVEHRIRRSDGTERTLLEHAEIVLDKRGQPERVIGAVADITERKRAEDEVRKLNQELEVRVKTRTAELQAAVTELEAFTSSVAHDLRSPVRHMAGFARILVDEYGRELNPAAREYLERIRSGATRMGKLVDDLLHLSRLGRRALNLQETNLQELAAEVVRELETETKGRHIEWRIGRLPPMVCDRVLLKQAFYNLLSNAVKYTRPRNPAVIELGCCENGGTNPIYVRDNGVGFNMSYAPKLFGIFQRLHREDEFEGTGVGLAVVQRVIQRHGGRVWAESEPGQGASFYFTLNPPTDGAQQNQA